MERKGLFRAQLSFANLKNLDTARRDYLVPLPRPDTGVPLPLLRLLVRPHKDSKEQSTSIAIPLLLQSYSPAWNGDVVGPDVAYMRH